MSSNTNIEWCDHTFNPWTGCTKVSPGCDHCYAEGWAKRSGQVQWGPQAARRRTSAANWSLPRRWNAQAEAFKVQHGRRQRVFCASLADVFDNAVDPAWRADLLTLIQQTPNLDWLLLTKRIGNVERMTMDALRTMFRRSNAEPPTWPWENVWLGATICNQAEADRDIPKLLAVPAQVRFLSMEPLLGLVDIDSVSRVPCPNAENSVMDPETECYECCRACDYTGVSDDWGIDWVIVGGESGPGARPMHPDWARSLRDQCAAAGVPFLFKQWGDWRAPQQGEEFDTSLGMAQRVPAFKRRTRLVMCNSVAQSVVESMRGKHPEFVFVYRRERVKNTHMEPSMPYRPITAMNNTGWQTARAKAGMADLHVHDLRHTVGMRLREAGVAESTVSDLLWHTKKSMTAHYSMAQIVELHAALEKIKADTGTWNKTLTTLRAEHQARLAGEATPPKVPQGLLERVA